MFKPNIEKLKAKRKWKKLIKALNYHDNKQWAHSSAPGIRHNAAKALGELGERKAVKPLSKVLLKAIRLEDDDTKIVQFYPVLDIINSIGNLKDSDAFSTGKWPPIPREDGHPFHSKVATLSTR